jgi:mitochondrial chaperone BCS1
MLVITAMGFSTGNYAALTPLTRECMSASLTCPPLEPIKRLLAYVKAIYAEENSNTITIRIPDYDTMHIGYREGIYSPWKISSIRQIRPMESVVVDSALRRQILQEVSFYLSAAGEEWYASRGIPLRLGYLFHGPPGTGKSSFTSALAGHFGLDIYLISLNKGGRMSDNILQTLFASLPRRCIVLLEDIDSSGVKRENISRPLGYSYLEENPGLSALTLAGLFNAIDGVASHEG